MITSIIWLPLSAIGFFCSCAPVTRAPSDQSGKPDFIADSTKISLYLPLDKLGMTVVDQTRSLKLPPLNDGFFIEVVNALMQFEVAQRFKVAPVGVHDSGKGTDLSPEQQFRSQIMAHVGSPVRVADLIRSIADQCSVDLVILPLNALVKEKISKKSGWRGDKFGQSYERPLDCLAEARITMQIWDRSGTMVYSRTSMGVSRKPLLYSLLKHEKNKKEDLVQFSKNMFAPPLIRALSSAVRQAFPQDRPASNRGRRN
jgi:hypothetical protein